MTDIELDTLELCTRGAMTDSWYTKTTSADDATAAFIAAANPAAILELIAELRQAKAERDWIIEQIENGWPCPPTSDEFVGDCDKEMSCKDCWIKAAKEATK